MSTVIKVENISKQYRLGNVGTGTLAHDLNRKWHRVRGMKDPYLKIGEENDRSVKGSSEYVWALRDINFDIQQGEVMGIIGRNGAGKSTLLKILSRTTLPTTGSVKIKGRVASLLEVGTGFHPELSGRENIYLNGAILGMTKHEIKNKFDEIVDFAGVERYIDTPVKRYSLGMYVRLAFGVAAHLEPEILIVDEVLAVGDAEFQKKALGKMKDVSQKEGRTVLFVSHNMGAIQTLCNKSILLSKGQVGFVGTQTETISKYLGVMKENRIDLVESKDRQGTGEIVVSKIYFRNIREQPIGSIMSGQTFDICMEYKLRIGIKLNNVLVGISIVNQMDQPIFSFHNRLTRDSFGSIENNGTFICRIEKTPLVPSLYSLSYSVMHENGYGGYIDHVPNVKSFSVIEGNFYNSGENSPLSHGQIMVEGNWKNVILK